MCWSFHTLSPFRPKTTRRRKQRFPSRRFDERADVQTPHQPHAELSNCTLHAMDAFHRLVVSSLVSTIPGTMLR